MVCVPAALVEIHLGILVLLGIGVLGGALGAWFFQKIRIPQVVGYIVVGLIVGRSGLKLLDTVQIDQLRSFTWFALGLIGFLVGGELKADTFRQYGRQFFQILLWEGLFAFVLVAAGSALIVFLVTGSVAAALAAGVVFGAIASATDPASTVEVLWEYRARGIMTMTVIAIIALDDALAMMLYGIGTSCAGMLTGGENHLLLQMGKVAFELLGSVVFGLIGGALMSMLLRFLHHKHEQTLAIAIGLLLVMIGLATMVHLDVILVTMVMGVVLINTAPHYAEKTFLIIKSFSVPIYVMFFVMVGARLSIGQMPLWLWVIVALYVVGRTVGKITGCWLGAKLSGAPEKVQRYCGLALFPQGGVAIGLSIMATQHLGSIAVNEAYTLGEVVVAGVTATTFIVQLIGPSMVKYSIQKAGELGRNITEQDVFESMNVGQVAMGPIEPVRQTDSLGFLLRRFSSGENLAYPVVDSEGKMIGLVTLPYLKDILTNSDCWDWMVVADVMVPEVKGVPESMPLAEALRRLEEEGYEQMPVLSDKDGRPVGILDLRHAQKIINQELIRRQSQA